jgi:hypothetical protein
MVNDSRNLVEDLIEGASDGAIKKAAPDRGGVNENDVIQRRNGILQDEYYDMWPAAGTTAKRDYVRDFVGY